MSNQPLQPLGQLLARTFAFYRGHVRLILLVTLPVVAFVDIVIGAGLGELTASVHKKLPAADSYIELAADVFVTVPLVTAMLARAVLVEREGVTAVARRAAEEGLELFAPALLAVVLWAGGVALGSFLIIPAIYIVVSWYFVVQAVVIDRCRGFGAVAMSSSLVRGHWWHTAAVVVCLELLTGIAAVVVAAAFEAAAKAANSDALIILGSIIVDTIALPYVAIGATLYYLELRDRAAVVQAQV
ncbi:MAG: hypothetical protein ABSC56_08735 [Solirubrobacteraceae bacterium]|jgi:hypothetical protein